MSIDLKVSQVFGEDEQNILQENFNNTLETLNISEGVEVGDYICLNCLALKTVNMPRSMEKIGKKAFSGCKNLTNITLPSDLKRIGDYAFEGCESILSLNLSKTITFIGDNAFSSCNPNLKLSVEAGSYAHAYVVNKGLNYIITSKQKYNVKFCDYDGTLLQTSTVEYGDNAIYNGEDPVRKQENNIVYTFIGWDKSLENITEDTTFVAQYDEQVFYRVQFVNYNTNIVLWSSLVEEGKTAIYKGNELDNTFIGWDKSLENITEDTTFYALYKTPENIHVYNVVFRNYDGALLAIEQVNRGGGVTYKGEMPKRPSTSEYLYEFFGWDKSLGNITEDLTVYAQYNATKLYSVKFVNAYANIVLWSSLVKEGDTAVYQGDELGDAFIGWDKSLENITEDTIFYATYSSVTNIQLGDNVSGEFIYDISTLKITGEGPMYDYSVNQQTNPINEFADYVEAVIVSNSITEFSKGVLSPCKNLTSLTIPFVGKSRDIAVEDTGNSESTIGYLFGTSDTEKKGYTYQQCNVRGSGVYSKLPKNIEYIELTDAKIIPFGAFWGLSSLKSIVIGDTCKEIYGKCFYGCDNLEEMTVPFIGRRQTTTPLDYYYDTNIGYWFDFQRMQTVYDPDWTSVSLTWKNEGRYNSDYTKAKTIGKLRRYPSLCYLANCLYFVPTTLKKVTVTSDTLIPSYAFSGNDTIREIYAPFAKEIGEGAFTKTKLSMYDFENVEIIGQKAFVESSINKFNFPNLKSIDREAFAKCSSLTEITLSKNVIFKTQYSYDYSGYLRNTGSSAVQAFDDCDFDIVGIYTPTISSSNLNCSAEKVITDEDTEYSNTAGQAIGALAGENSEFYKNGILIINNIVYGLSSSVQFEELTIPSGTIKIAQGALNDKNFTKLILPTGIENMEIQTTVSFSELEIEDNDMVTVFSGLYAFRYKDAFVNIVQEIYPEFYQNEMIIKGDTLYYCSPNISGDILLSDDIKHIAPYAFNTCTKITSVKLPTQLESIGNNAFSGCTGLTGGTIVVPKTLSLNNYYHLGGLTSFCNNIVYEDGTKHICIGYKNSITYTIPESTELIEYKGTFESKATFVLMNSGFCKFNIPMTKMELIDKNGSSITKICQNLDAAECTPTDKNVFYNYKKITNIKLKGFDILPNQYACCDSSDAVLTSASVENCKVIGSFAFNMRTSLKDVTGIDEVLRYDKACFQHCSKLETQFGTGARQAGDYSFNHTGTQADYSSFFIPEYFTNVGGSEGVARYSNYGTHMFYGCGKAAYFKEFVVHTRNQDFKAVDGVLYTIDGKRLVAAPRGIVTTKDNPLYILEGVERMDELGLGAKNYLGAIVIPDSYEIIEFLPPSALNQWANTLTGALYFDSPITHILVKETNPRYTSIDGMIYSKDMREFWATSYYQKGELILKNGLTHIRHGAFAFETKAIATGAATGRNNKFTKISIPATCYDIDDYTGGTNEFTKLGWLTASQYCTIEIDERNRWYSVGASALVKKSLSESAFSYTNDVFDIMAFDFAGIFKTALCFSRFITEEFDIANFEGIYESEYIQSEISKNHNNISALLERLEYFASKNARPVILMIDDRARLVTSYTNTGNTITLSCYTGEANEAISVEISYSGTSPTSVTEYYYNKDAAVSDVSNVKISFIDSEEAYIYFKDLMDNANS